MSKMWNKTGKNEHMHMSYKKIENMMSGLVYRSSYLFLDEYSLLYYLLYYLLYSLVAFLLKGSVFASFTQIMLTESLALSIVILACGH